MSRIEHSIALPIRRMVNPAQRALGSAIAVSGLAILLHGALALS